MKRLLLVAVVLAVTLTGCGRYASPYPPAIPPSHDDLVGTWVHEDEDTSTGASMTLSDDGTVHFDGVPVEVLASAGTGDEFDFQTSTDLRTGEGTWSFDPDQTFFDRLTVNIDLDDFAFQQADYGARFLAIPPELSFVIGDPDSGVLYQFTQQQ